jgi:hypothetical protein
LVAARATSLRKIHPCCDCARRVAFTRTTIGGCMDEAYRFGYRCPDEAAQRAYIFPAYTFVDTTTPVQYMGAAAGSTRSAGSPISLQKARNARA